MSWFAKKQYSGSEPGNDYRYKRFTTRLLFRDLQFRPGSAKPGDALPPFELVTTGGGCLENSKVFGAKPVLLIFGSVTCPMTASAAPSMQELYDEFGEHIDFIMLYVREAHPGEHFAQAETLEEKLEHAHFLKKLYNIEWTVAADSIDGDLHRALDPKPNSAFLMDKEGKILFRSLWAADHQALHQALQATAEGQLPDKRQSAALIGPVILAMGRVYEVMERGGPQAVKDLWRAGFPMALAGRLATFFTPLSPDQRGIAAVITLAIAMLTALGVFMSWMLG
jgi:hypothetical protein